MWRTAWEEWKRPVYEQWKAEWLRTHPAEVGDASWEYLFTGGKEIRARLFCEVWSSLAPDDRPPCAELAFVWECIHVTSLVLDDTPWMDNASHRRGRPTLHRTFSEKKALLLAHDVMKMAEHIWTAHCPPHLTHVAWNQHLHRHLERLAVGQWYDLEKKGTLVELASLKTGVLFEAVVETVALCLELDTAFWSTWGNRVGILFQWADDWDDREEDHVQDNRNAFHEAPVATVENYRRLWNRVLQDMGSSWWERPFGRAMKTYFAKEGIVEEAEPVCLPSSLQAWLTLQAEPFVYDERCEEEKKRCPLIRGTGMIHYLLALLRKRNAQEGKVISFLSTDLWSLPESSWMDVPEIQERIYDLEAAAEAAAGKIGR